MQMQTFYSRLMASREDNPLFLALRSLSRLDPRLLADGDESNAWSPWDPTGAPPDYTSQLAAEPA